MIPFKKYHGCGNHFILIKEKDVSGMDWGALALRLCDPATGIGGDGLIIVKTKPALEMRIFNKDGTEAPMCGNGIRCFAAFCHEEGIETQDRYQVRTLAGMMTIERQEGTLFTVKVNMGKPSFRPADCGIKVEDGDITSEGGASKPKDGDSTFEGGGSKPKDSASKSKGGEPKPTDGEPKPKGCGVEKDLKSFVRQPLETPSGTFIVDSLFIGTVHTVVFVDAFLPEATVKALSNHPIYREKTNVNMVKQIDRKTLEVRTYERGVGMTLACGTGACAAMVAARLHQKCDERVTVKLPRGSLTISQEKDGQITMTGTAEKIFEGNYTKEPIGGAI